MLKFKRIFSFLLISILVCISLSGCSDKNTLGLDEYDMSKSVNDDDWQIASGELITLNNGRINFDFNSSTTHFTITDTLTEKTYTSVPSEDIIAIGGEYSSRMASEITLTYYEKGSRALNLYSNDDSVSIGNFEVKTNGDAIRVYYTFGAKEIFVPEFFSEKEFEEICAVLSSSQSNRLKRYYSLHSGDSDEYLDSYPILKKQSIYILNFDVSDTQRSEIDSYMKTAEYTEEKYNEAIETLGVKISKGEDKVGFTVPVEYSLNEDGFSAEILSDRIIEASSTFKLQAIELLEYFDSKGADAEGEYLVPDGSGAMIALNEKDSAVYTKCFYGEDFSVKSENQAQLDKNLMLPVFGTIYEDGNSVLAIIENAAEVATLNVSPLNASNPQNHIYCTFSTRSIDSTETETEAPVYNIFSKHLLNISPKIRYAFLTGENASVMGIAGYYQSYLSNKGFLNNNKISGEPPLYLDYYCMTVEKATVLGVPYTKKTVLSTLEGIISSVKSLHKSGIQNLVVRLYGYGTDGLEHKAVNCFSVDRRVGTKAQLNELNDLLISKGGKLCLDADIQFVYKSGNGFNASNDAAHYLNRVLVRKGRYDIVTRSFEKEVLNRYFVTPALYSDYANGILKGAKSVLNNDFALSFGTAGRFLGGDYTSKKDIDRAQAVMQLENALDSIKNTKTNMIFDNGNQYVLPFAQSIAGVPLTSSQYNIEKQTVPFYQAVLHGKLNYCGEPYNTSQDKTYIYLKSVEYGAALHTAFITEDDTVLRDTNYVSVLYSMSDQSRLNGVINDYNATKSILGKVSNAKIIANSEIAPNVFRTDYDNGISVAVNYSNKDISIQGITVKAESFTEIL